MHTLEIKLMTEVRHQTEKLLRNGGLALTYGPHGGVLMPYGTPEARVNEWLMRKNKGRELVRSDPALSASRSEGVPRRFFFHSIVSKNASFARPRRLPYSGF
jgi:hypothetical protein